MTLNPTPEGFENVFAALYDDPATVARHTLAAELLMALRRHLRTWALPPAAAAAPLGISRARLGDIQAARAERFTLEELLGLGATAGLCPRLRVEPAAAEGDRQVQGQEGGKTVGGELTP